jgi:hypothetical protein
MEGVATFFRLAVNVDVVIEQQFDYVNQIVLFLKSAHQMKGVPGVPPFVIGPVDVYPSFQEEFNQLDCCRSDNIDRRSAGRSILRCW